MPLYMCNAAKGAIDAAAKQNIAVDITKIHCDVTGAPPHFVHAFFVEEAPYQPLNGMSAVLLGSIRAGRTEAQKSMIASEMRLSIHRHAGIPIEEIVVTTSDTPASWVMEGGVVMPEPGDEAAWLEAKHPSKEDSRGG